MQKMRPRFLQNEQQAATRCFNDFIVRENKRFHWFLVQQQVAESAVKFFAYVFTRKQSANQRKKYRAVTFY